MDETEREYAFDTLAVHAGAEPDELTGAVSPPIYQTATYAQDGVGRPRDGYEYARGKNPTRERLERAVAALEGGRHGIAFASGSAATAALAELAGPGDEIVIGDDVYGGTYRYLERVHRPKGIGTRYVDLTAGDDTLHEALNERTRAVWFESPTNPLLKIVDIGAVARVMANFGLDDLASAEECYVEARDICREIGGHVEGHALNNLGRVYHHLHRHDEAVASLEEALAKHRSAGAVFGEAITLKHLGEVYADIGDLGKAGASLTGALHIFERIGEHAEATEVAELLAPLAGGNVPREAPASP